MLKKFLRAKQTLQKMQRFFFCEFQIITVLLLIRNSYTSRSMWLISLKLWLGFSIFVYATFLLNFIFLNYKCGEDYTGKMEQKTKTRWSEHNNLEHKSEPVRHILKNVDHIITWTILALAPKKRSIRKPSSEHAKEPHLIVATVPLGHGKSFSLIFASIFCIFFLGGRGEVTFYLFIFYFSVRFN